MYCKARSLKLTLVVVLIVIICESGRQITVSIPFNTLQNVGKNVVFPSLYFVKFLTYKKCVRGFILLIFSFGDESSVILAEKKNKNKAKCKFSVFDCFVDL